MAICAALREISKSFHNSKHCRIEHALIACLKMYPLVLVTMVSRAGMDVDATHVVVGRTMRGFAGLCVDMGYSVYGRELLS